MSAEPISAGRTSEEVRRTLAERIGSGQLRPGQRLGAERVGDPKLGLRRGQRTYAFVFKVFDH